MADLEQAVAYYSKLFDAESHKRRPGYANFAIDKPPLKLVLLENPDAYERLNHLGVEVFHAEEVDIAARRLFAARLLAKTEHESTCCYATQDKVRHKQRTTANPQLFRAHVPLRLSDVNRMQEDV